MNLVGYIRVSTDAQADNTSFEEQQKGIESYCNGMGHNLVRVFKEVGSGKNTEDRPMFNAALEAVKEADGLIAFKLDRVARNTRDVLKLVEDTLKPSNKALVLLDLKVDTSTPSGLMILTVMAAVAQLERDVIRDRTQTGRKAKAAQGGYAFGAPPYGYKSVDGNLVEVPEEQEVIGIIRRHHQSHRKSLREIATYLNENGYKTKRGSEWTAQQIKNVLDKKQ